MNKILFLVTCFILLRPKKAAAYKILDIDSNSDDQLDTLSYRSDDDDDEFDDDAESEEKKSEEEIDEEPAKKKKKFTSSKSSKSKKTGNPQKKGGKAKAKETEEKTKLRTTSETSKAIGLPLLEAINKIKAYEIEKQHLEQKVFTAIAELKSLLATFGTPQPEKLKTVKKKGKKKKKSKKKIDEEAEEKYE